MCNYLVYVLLLSNFCFCAVMCDRPNYNMKYNEHCCQFGLCEHIEYYPEKEIDALMEKEEVLQYLLRGTVIEQNVTVESRLAVGSERMCRVSQRNLKPLKMRNVNGECKTLVNTANYQQTFSTEICINIRGLGGNVERCSDFGMQCRQDYQDISLIIYEDEKLKFDKFSVPIACRCCGGY